MDWNSLLVGLVGGLAGGVLGASAAVLAILLQFDAEIDREERTVRRSYRNENVQTLRRLLGHAEQRLSSTFQRELWDGSRDKLKTMFKGLDLSSEQIEELHQHAIRRLAPLSLPADIVREFTGVLLAIDDDELRNHLFLLYGELVAGEEQGVLKPHQLTYLVRRTHLLLERYASILPREDERSGVQRLARVISLKRRSPEPQGTSPDALRAMMAEIESDVPLASEHRP